MDKEEFKIGDKIKFKEEKQRYTIQACNSRYLICTKPLNIHKTYLYTIVDLHEGIRGPDYSLLGPYHEYNTVEGAKKGLKELMIGKIDISYRHRIKTNIA